MLPKCSIQPVHQPYWLAILLLLAATPASAMSCNTAPIAANDEVPHYGKTIYVDVLANDTELDGEPMSVTMLSTTCNGTVSEELGLVKMVPATDARETCEIKYQVIDEQGATSAEATVLVKHADFLFGDGFETGDASKWI